jgi:hypothetical protein
MNRVKWIVFLVIALAIAQSQAQGFQGGPGQGPGPNPPNLPPQFDPEIIKRLQPPKFDPGTLPRFDPGPYSLRLHENQLSKPHKWVWPEWVCWQSALGLFALSLVIGFFYGRFGLEE